MPIPSVALIILNWNQRDLTLDCLRSVRERYYPAGRVITILVDNASTDGSAEAVRADFPEAIVIVNPDNLGFAQGNNPGIRHALGTGADYIMLMTNSRNILLFIARNRPGLLPKLTAWAGALLTLVRGLAPDAGVGRLLPQRLRPALRGARRAARSLGKSEPRGRAVPRRQRARP